MTSETTPAPPRPLLDDLFGELWPERAKAAADPRLVAAAAAAGLVGAVVIPYRVPGLGWLLTLLAVTAVVAVAAKAHRSRRLTGLGALCVLLMSVTVVRDAEWIVVLCLLAAFGVGAVPLAGGRTLLAMIASAAAVPLAGLRGIPWLGRSVRATTRHASGWAAVRTVIVSALLVACFGALFASADALFAKWTDALVPDLSIGGAVVRAFVFAFFTGLTLAGCYVALVPPAVAKLALRPGRAVRRFEWAVPVGLVCLVFAAFLAAQATAMFGGHGYLHETTGLTYAEYVHQGFGQLTVATALTVLVVAVAARHAPRRTTSERVWLRGLLGLLCGLTLVVVASALFRMHVYEQAYGFTQLRLLVSVFEAWLGVVLLLVLVAGLRLRGAWVPLAALVSGAVMLLGLAAINPDGYVAHQNVQRFAETGKIDVDYLATLSDDAVPALATLPEPQRDCVLGGRSKDTGDWLEWNLGRSRARTVSAPTERCGRS